MPRVRLEDVARVAGVSMKTVSNVVHDYPHVSEKMRTKVQRAIDDLGYRPNLLGRRLATGRTGMIALAFPDLALPYFAELAKLVFKGAADRGYRVLVEQTDGTLDGERGVIAANEAGLVDGVLFHPSFMSTAEIATHRQDVPLVLLGESPAPLTVDHVMIDNVAAAFAATGHLLKLGRRRIAFVGHEAYLQSATSNQRLAGYQNALEAAGVSADPRMLIPSASITAADAASGVRNAIDHGLRFDGLVCRDDLAAIGALRALHDRGRRVPEDVAVVGWDDIHMAALTIPALTTIAANTSQLTEVALDLLERRIDGHQGVGRHELVDFQLVVRESAPRRVVTGSD